MKRTMKLLSFILVFAFVLSIVACSAASNGAAMGAPIGTGGGFYGDADMPSEPVEPDTGVDGELDDKGDSDETEEDKKDDEDKNENIRLPAGMITAGAWDDNQYYQMWHDLFAQPDEENSTAGKFYVFTKESTSWGFDSLHRVKVSVKCGEQAVAGAQVIARDGEGNALYSAISDAQGNAYLFPDELDGTLEIISGNGSATAQFDKDNRDITVELAECGKKLNVIEIMFVVDVTGSMGDEISFLKRELEDVIERISEADEQTVIRLAFLFYRDLEDRVPFDYYDFSDVTTSDGLALKLTQLEKQYASGGGDYQEAVDKALEMAVNEQWSTGATTKLIFQILDAPAHSGAKYKERFNKAVDAAAEKGIRICPIICSGADSTTEYTMREAAIHTGGTFIFVTDDSGIGNAHHDPNIPNVTVELLNSMLVRLVKGYHTGEFEPPVYWTQDPGLAQTE